jgi:multicomponent Na+:H+ antiporter subunit A
MLIFTVLSGFVCACLAPWAQHHLRHTTGWVLAALPLALFCFFATQIAPISIGSTLIESYPWIPDLGVTFSLRLDGLSLLFGLLISGIGTLIFIYAGGYLRGDPQIGRLYSFLMMFMASMLGLVLSDNLLLLFIFWELTTVSSYLLIGYKHHYEKARKAALQGMLVTGAGGLAMLAGFVLLANSGGSFTISSLFSQASAIQADPLYTAIFALVALGAFTKSAQFPFHFWLPGAMEAPSPVSAYLHSATMVKAGVFLLARLSPVLGGTATWQTTLVVVGSITLLAGYLLAVLQTDLKRILAYTTVAALGTLVMLLGIGGDDGIKAAMTFLLAHALYKGALFMAAGTIDHETGTRDIRQLGGLLRAMPYTGIAATLAALSFAGVPLLFGFVGKELVYKAALISTPVIALAVIANILGVAAAGLAVAGVFYGKNTQKPPKKPHEGPIALWIGPLILATGSIVLGIMPSLANGLIGAAAGAVANKSKTVELVLWPGIEGANGLALALSALTLIVGIGLYSGRQLLFTAATRSAGLMAYGPEGMYHAALRALVRIADWQTRLLQSGSLRTYLAYILITLLGLAGITLALRVPFSLPQLSIPQIHEVGIAVIMLIATVVLLRATSRLVAVIALGVVGYGVALVFLYYGGPDLAMTQFTIETLSVVLFVLVLYRLPRYAQLTTRSQHVRDGVLAAVCGGLFLTLTIAALVAATDSRLTPYFAENSLKLANGLNVVNVIIVDFRGFDTLGEITVLGVAALGIYALIAMRPTDQDANEDRAQAAAAVVEFDTADSLILRVATRFLLPLLLVFSVFLLIRGHNAPGGGFVGGLVAATAFVLFALAEGVPQARKTLLLNERAFIPIGLTIAVVSAMISLMLGQPLMTGLWLATPLPVLGKIGTPVIFDLGVYFLVFGIALTIIFSLMDTPARAGLKEEG